MGYTTLQDTATAGNAALNFTAPANKLYVVKYGEVILDTDASVANRYVRVGVYDDAGTPELFYDVHSGLAVTANQIIHHQLMPGTYRETSAVDNAVQVPMGAELIIFPGWSLRVSVANGVEGDSFSAKFLIDEQ